MKDLKSDEGLREACERLLDGPASLAEVLPWFPAYARFVADVLGVEPERRVEPEFHRLLWLEDPSPRSERHEFEFPEAAIDDGQWREWFAEWSRRETPAEQRWTFFSQFIDQARRQLEPHAIRSPRVGLRRGAALFHPDALTGLVLKKPLERLGRALGVVDQGFPLRVSLAVAERLSDVLGPCSGEPTDVARRLALSHALYRSLPEDGDANERDAADRAAVDELKGDLSPLPAAQRRRGLTALRNRLDGFWPILEFLRDGASSEELFEFLQTEAEDYKRSSLAVWINALRNEFDLVRKDGNEYGLTVRGLRLLEERDPFVLADFLVTRVLGIDAALVGLAEDGPLAQEELYAALRAMNPGWTTNFAVSAIVAWLRSFGVIERDEEGRYRLTDEGRRWAELVTWTPEPYVPEEGPDGDSEPPPIEPRIATPPLAAIRERLGAHGHFPDGLVAQLHAGLWAHRQRHFAVLAGLSGSGKTLLARGYALALFDDPEHARKRLRTVAVQPGWYDPSPLLGHVNPLREEHYVRTEFLEFLLAAAMHPEEPFVVVLDEMNLSHPEQYLAPLLSAMETGAAIHLHSEGEQLDGVPARLPYPPNLVLIGTVNMDETTHGLSDKVLDRAFTLEFWDIDLERYPKWEERELDAATRALARRVLGDLMAALAPARLHFGWRVVGDVLDFLARVQADGGALEPAAAIDAVVYAKVLPKLRGEDAPRFRRALEATAKVLEGHGLERSRAKLAELAEDLEHRGSARFWR